MVITGRVSYGDSSEGAIHFGRDLVLVQRQQGLFFKSAICWHLALHGVAVPYRRLGTTYRLHPHRSGDLKSRRGYFGSAKMFFDTRPQIGVGSQLRYASKLQRKNYNSINLSNRICWWVQVRRCERNCQCHVETCSCKCETNNQTRIGIRLSFLT
jgi:hypothetical protein